MAFSDIDAFYIDLGLRIKTQRLALNFTQEALANELELTRASIINLENGRHKPSVYQIVLIAKYFNIDYTKLIPVPVELVVDKEKKTVPDLSNMVSDQEEIDSPSKQAILDFLSSVKKK